ncbi:MAG: hypothetical protein ACXVP8_06280 [Actinomycetota bacterium]
MLSTRLPYSTRGERVLLTHVLQVTRHAIRLDRLNDGRPHIDARYGSRLVSADSVGDGAGKTVAATSVTVPVASFSWFVTSLRDETVGSGDVVVAGEAVEAGAPETACFGAAATGGAVLVRLATRSSEGSLGVNATGPARTGAENCAVNAVNGAGTLEVASYPPTLPPILTTRTGSFGLAVVDGCEPPMTMVAIDAANSAEYAMTRGLSIGTVPSVAKLLRNSQRARVCRDTGTHDERVPRRTVRTFRWEKLQVHKSGQY